MRQIEGLTYWILILAITGAAIAAAGCAEGGNGGEATGTGSALSGQTVTGSVEETVIGEPPTIPSITEKISAIRELPVIQEIHVSYISREQLGGELAQELEKEYPPGEMAVEEKVLIELGLLDPDEDLEDTISQLLGEGILGFYDEETKELKVVSDDEEMSPLNELTLAHEITHALQDQSFSLGSLLPTEGSGNDDRDLAVLALIEGDATVAEEEYVAQNMGLADALNLLLVSLGAPMGLGPSSYIEDSITFPYVKGRDFVMDIRSEGGWRAVDDAYARPPESTEQVMHPEKYVSGEPPLEVKVPDLSATLGEGWQHTYENVIGEFDVLDILRAAGDGSSAARAAAGWGGGSIEFYEQESSDSQVLVMVLSWDTVADADEFTLAMAQSLESRTGSSFIFEPGAIPFLQSDGEYWVMAQRGNKSVVVAAPERDQGDRVATTVLGLS